jgi:hypothetical protein
MVFTFQLALRRKVLSSLDWKPLRCSGSRKANELGGLVWCTTGVDVDRMRHELFVFKLFEEVKNEALKILADVRRMTPGVVLWQPESIRPDDSREGLDEGKQGLEERVERVERY